jgi:hypothetical protein
MVTLPLKPAQAPFERPKQTVKEFSSGVAFPCLAIKKGNWGSGQRHDKQ